jgi:6-pyruvoyltetrahydropterin/6-carboxytetrahydropterin synthase
VAGFSYSLSFKYRFEAAHRFTLSCADSCATPHGHTWYAEALFEAGESDLGPDDMVMEFAALKGAWKSFIQKTVDHSFLHHHEDPILPALRQAIPSFRGLPFPGDPTTELVAALFFAKLRAMHQAIPGSEKIHPVGVFIQETPTNAITFRAPNAGRSTLLEKIDSRFDGWWNSPEPSDRGLQSK